MTDVLIFLAPPFVASLILTGIHAYLGLHVVERGVIFVDLALAQIAALGGVIALVAGYEFHSTGSYWFSLGFTIVGAAIFAWTRAHTSRIPHEAIIGIVYAVAAAAAILVMSKAPHGTEHLKDMLVGNILTVDWTTIAKTAVLYGVVGAFHYVYRKQFLLISLDPAAAVETGMKVRLWDFLFYSSFGFVVTSSVEIAGVLLVFSYLIVPSVAAMLFFERTRTRLAAGWIVGTVVSAGGVAASFYLDLPTGATIVCTFGVVLAIMAVGRPVFSRARHP